MTNVSLSIQTRYCVHEFDDKGQMIATFEYGDKNSALDKFDELNDQYRIDKIDIDKEITINGNEKRKEK